MSTPIGQNSPCFVNVPGLGGLVLSHIDDTISRAGILFVEVRGMLVRLIVERLSTCIRMKVLLIL